MSCEVRERRCQEFQRIDIGSMLANEMNSPPNQKIQAPLEGWLSSGDRDKDIAIRLPESAKNMEQAGGTWSWRSGDGKLMSPESWRHLADRWAACWEGLFKPSGARGAEQLTFRSGGLAV